MHQKCVDCGFEKPGYYYPEQECPCCGGKLYDLVKNREGEE